MKQISKKEIKEKLIMNFKVQTPNFWEQIQDKLEPQVHHIYSDTKKKSSLISLYRVGIIFIIAIIITSISFRSKLTNYVINNFSKTKEKIAINSQSTSKQDNEPVKVSSSPAMRSFHEWQNKYYQIESNQGIDKNQIGKYIGKYYNTDLFEIKGIDSTKSIAVTNVKDFYLKANFVFNATINWNNKIYEINPNYTILPNLNNEKIDKYLGKINSFDVYSIQGVDTNQEISLYYNKNYIIAIRK
ncbi:hypothetical protein [Candidatus Clostridium radicumherbarum]|uniref:Uncharacterized protein n=1 Tax=Candidatus Clostridium radicumherbarum TaxID=3381662 RepID=A0ABW8TRW7_9CLOT